MSLRTMPVTKSTAFSRLELDPVDTQVGRCLRRFALALLPLNLPAVEPRRGLVPVLAAAGQPLLTLTAATVGYVLLRRGRSVVPVLLRRHTRHHVRMRVRDVAGVQ